MAIIDVRTALNQALEEEMRRDGDVFLIGEEVAQYNGAYKISKGLLDKFGPKRVIDTPISESGFTGLSVGSAMMGLRPVVEFMSFNFSLVAIDQIISNASKMMYMTGGQFSVPIVFRGCNGAASQVSSQHSHCMESIFAYFPGIHVIAPHTAADFKGLLKSAIRNNDPVIFLENEMMYSDKGEVPEDPDFLVPIGKGRIHREGDDVTIIAHQRAIHWASQAADILAKEGISVEIFDPRTLKPFDMEGAAASVKKTGRVVIVEEGHYWCGIGAQYSHMLYSELFDYLDAPIVRVTQHENPMPYAKNLEDATLPSAARIVEAVKKVCYTEK
jgi:pyruvate dehydrogenase E1 component beta subunit